MVASELVLASLYDYRSLVMARSGRPAMVLSGRILWPDTWVNRKLHYLLLLSGNSHTLAQLQRFELWLTYYGRSLPAGSPVLNASDLCGLPMLFRWKPALAPATMLQHPGSLQRCGVPQHLLCPGTPGAIRKLHNVQLDSVSVTDKPLPGHEFHEVVKAGDWCKCASPDFIENTAGGKPFTVCRKCLKEKQA